MKKAILLSLFGCLLFTGPASAQVPAALAARLQTVLDSVCNRYRIKGTSAAVLIPGIGTWKGVHGSSHTGQPITSNMLFGIGSNTKTYVAAVLLKMEENALISIDDTIGRWIQNQPNVSGAITIRQLLNHTSGLYNYTESAAWGDSVFSSDTRIWQPEEILQFIGAPYFAPGLRHEYSNTNYLLAGLIIKQVLGQTAGATLQSYIFTPQQLGNTIFFPEQAPAAPVAHSWSNIVTGSYQEDLVSTYGYSHNSMFSMAYTAGAIMATAEDNAQFWHRLLSGRIISATSLSRMRTFVPVAAGSPVGYGLGISRYPNFNGRIIYTHGGSNLGFINENLVDSTSGIAITALTNQDSIGNGILLNSLIRALHRVTIQMPVTAVSNTPLSSPLVQLYPNPANAALFLNNNYGKISCELTDITGKTMLHTSLETGTHPLPVAQLPAGQYIMNIRSADGQAIYRQTIVLQH